MTIDQTTTQLNEQEQIGLAVADATDDSNVSVTIDEIDDIDADSVETDGDAEAGDDAEVEDNESDE